MILDLLSLSFRFPEVFLLAPFFLLFPLLRRDKYKAAKTPSISFISEIPPTLRQRLRSPILRILRIILLAAVIVGASGPYSTRLIELPSKARNIILSIDISRSMATADFSSERGILPRFEAVRAVVSSFVAERAGDRIGLVVFGSSAFVQAPLTTDHTILQDLIKRLDVGMAGDGTAIGEGLALALKRLGDVSPKSAAIVLLTDGVNNSGIASPKDSAEIAKKMGIRTHTIGIGSSSVQLDPFGAPINAEFDEKTLKLIAKTTGGEYFHANSLHQLKKVYEQIDKLERTTGEPPWRELRIDYSYIFAGISLIAFLLILTLSRTIFLRIPE